MHSLPPPPHLYVWLAATPRWPRRTPGGHAWGVGGSPWATVAANPAGSVPGWTGGMSLSRCRLRVKELGAARWEFLPSPPPSLAPCVCVPPRDTSERNKHDSETGPLRRGGGGDAVGMPTRATSLPLPVSLARTWQAGSGHFRGGWHGDKCEAVAQHNAGGPCKRCCPAAHGHPCQGGGGGGGAPVGGVWRRWLLQ